MGYTLEEIKAMKNNTSISNEEYKKIVEKSNKECIKEATTKYFEKMGKRALVNSITGNAFQRTIENYINYRTNYLRRC